LYRVEFLHSQGHFRPFNNVCVMSAFHPIATKLLALRQATDGPEADLARANRRNHQPWAYLMPLLHLCIAPRLTFECERSTLLPYVPAPNANPTVAVANDPLDSVERLHDGARLGMSRENPQGLVTNRSFG
jgi:hypothetical protein